MQERGRGELSHQWLSRKVEFEERSEGRGLREEDCAFPQGEEGRRASGERCGAGGEGGLHAVIGNRCRTSVCSDVSIVNKLILSVSDPKQLRLSINTSYVTESCNY